MNPVPFILLAISLPLLLGGCGEKEVVEPVTEVKPQLEGVNNEELEFSGGDGIAYHKGSPYTGKTYSLHPNGKKKSEWNYKDGELDGLITRWRDNGQKKSELKYQKGKLVEGSEKYWNSEGEPVDLFGEALEE